MRATRRLGDALDFSPPSLSFEDAPGGFDWQTLHTSITPGPFDLSPPSIATGASGGWSDFSPENLSKWLQTGLMAYSQFRDIQQGGHPFGTLPTGQPAPPPGADELPPDPVGFDWNQLVDFGTPYPYAIAAVLIGGVWFLTRGRRRK